MKHWSLLLVAVGLGACAESGNRLDVKQFYVRDQRDETGTDPLIRGEKNRIFYGAVSMAERRDRLGQYYTVLWEDPEGAGASHEVVFEFQQGGTGSTVKRRSQTFGEGTSGKAAFSVIGDDYFKSGKVLAWKISLLRDGVAIDSRQSYLWQ